jgi:hypothetical protein
MELNRLKKEIKFMPNKPSVKTKPAPVVKPVVVKPTPKPAPKPAPVVSPPAPPDPVWQRLDIPANCDRFDTNQLAAHAGAIVSLYTGEIPGDSLIGVKTYGLGYVNIVPPVGTKWTEQSMLKGIYKDTGVTFNGNLALTLDGGVGSAKLMRYLKQ